MHNISPIYTSVCFSVLTKVTSVNTKVTQKLISIILLKNIPNVVMFLISAAPKNSFDHRAKM